MIMFLACSCIGLWTAWLLWAILLACDEENVKPYKFQERARYARVGCGVCAGYTLVTIGYLLAVLIGG